MTTIKGPIRIGGKNSNILEKLKEKELKIKTPFGERSTKDLK